jgi:hypothetical protein
VNRQRALALALSGAALLALTVFEVAVPGTDDLGRFLAIAAVQAALYAAAVWAAWNGRSSRLLAGIAVVAAGMRLAALTAPPFLSTDVYRYVWDGRVQAAGISPYRYIPADPHLEDLRDPEIFPQINRNNYAPTIYPPVAEAIFFAVTRVSESVTAMKAAMVGFEAVTFVLLLNLLAVEGLPTCRVVVYAWHPLALWEFAGNGHIDAALIAFVVAALWAAQRGRDAVAGTALAAATLVKFYPALLLPSLWRRRSRVMPAAFAAAIVLAYLPFIGVGWRVLGFLPGYAGEEGFNTTGGGFYWLDLLRHVPGLGGLTGQIYIAGAGAILLVLAVAIFCRPERLHSPFRAAAVLATAFLVLLSPHYPWYFAVLVIFACFFRSLALLWLTNACLLLYLVPVGSHILRSDYRLAIETMIYGPFAALALSEYWQVRRGRRSR